MLAHRKRLVEGGAGPQLAEAYTEKQEETFTFVCAGLTVVRIGGLSMWVRTNGPVPIPFRARYIYNK